MTKIHPIGFPSENKTLKIFLLIEGVVEEYFIKVAKIFLGKMTYFEYKTK